MASAVSAAVNAVPKADKLRAVMALAARQWAEDDLPQDVIARVRDCFVGAADGTTVPSSALVLLGEFIECDRQVAGSNEALFGALAQTLLAIPCSHLLGEPEQVAFIAFGCDPAVHGPMEDLSFTRRALITAGLMPLCATEEASLALFRTIVTSMLHHQTAVVEHTQTKKALPRAALAIARVRIPEFAGYRLEAFRYIVSQQAIEKPRVSLLDEDWVVALLHVDRAYADTLVECLLGHGDGESLIVPLRRVSATSPYQCTTPGFLEQQIGLLYPSSEVAPANARRELTRLLVESKILAPGPHPRSSCAQTWPCVPSSTSKTGVCRSRRRCRSP
jgi:hypothetical protein